MNAAGSRHARAAMLRGGGNRPRSLQAGRAGSRRTTAGVLEGNTVQAVSSLLADLAGFMTMAIARGRCVLEKAGRAGSPVRGIRGVRATRTVRVTGIVPAVRTISPVRVIRGVPAIRTVRTWAIVRLRGTRAMVGLMATAVLVCAPVEGGVRSRGGFRRLIALRYHTGARRASGTAAITISATG